MTTSNHSGSRKSELIDLLEQLHDRTNCRYETMRQYIEQEMLGGEYTSDQFRNKFRDRDGSRSTYDVYEIKGVVRALTEQIDESVRCNADEAIRLFVLAGLGDQAVPAVGSLFPHTEFDAAWARQHNLPQPTQMSALHLPEYPKLFVGREQHVTQVQGRLGIPPSAFQRPLTVIRGWPGVGKSTFVNHLAYDRQVRAAFPDGVLWTSVGNNANVTDPLKKWGRTLLNYEVQHLSAVEDIIETLRQTIASKKLLLVVDDIWNLPDGQWFRRLLTPRSFLILTTRFTDLAMRLVDEPNDVYFLPELTTEQSLELLRLVAPRASEQYQNRLTTLARTLEGLPLALRVAGRLIEEEERLNLNVEHLIDQLESEFSLIEQDAPSDRMDESTGMTVPIRLIFESSIATLSSEARKAFAYLGAFASKPATFDLKALKSVWKTDDPLPLVRILVGRGLLEPTADGRFQMHYTLSMYAKSLLKGSRQPSNERVGD